MNKLYAYKDLVAKRKSCHECTGLCNPSGVARGQYDSDHIGPWSLWQANMNAEVVVVGQDWGDTKYFNKWQGRDQSVGNPTNKNLQKLLSIIGVKIGRPQDQQDQVIFLTNLILCLKTGGLQGRVEDEWFANCSCAFFKPLIEIINPRAIIALGRKVSESILDAYGISFAKNTICSEMLSNSPYNLTTSTVLFPVYHCGAGSVNRNRSMPEQKEDWLKINKWLESSHFH